MARLRDPKGGCPWDLDQTFETIAPYTIEEAYEVADAIAIGDRDLLLDELGDLLFQVVYYAQMSREEGGFDSPTTACFNALAADIDPKFYQFTTRNMAFDVVDLLGWQTFNDFSTDLASLA